MRTAGEGVLSRSRRRSCDSDSNPGRWPEASPAGVWTPPGDVADSGSARAGDMLKYPFCLVVVSAEGAPEEVCFDKLPDEEEEDCPNEAVDGLGRTPAERFARAAFVFSRAIAAIDSLLCLAWWPTEALVLVSGSREEVGWKEGACRVPVEP